MEDERGLVWITAAKAARGNTHGNIGPGHPDYPYWEEEARFDEWLDSGGEGVPVRPLPVEPTEVEIPPVALAVTPDQAAALLSISRDTFDKRVIGNLRVARAGTRTLIPVRELERWLSENSAYALQGK